MTLLFADSFDGVLTRDKKWTSFHAGASIGTSFGRNGTNGLSYAKGGAGVDTVASLALAAGSNRVIAGAWINHRTGSSTNNAYLRLDATVGYFEVRSNPATNQLWVEGTGITGGNDGSMVGPVGAFPSLTWVFVEMLWEPGVLAQVRINNQEIYSTTPGGSGTPNLLSLRLGSGTVWWDDIYVLDTSGSHNNDYLGPLKIVALKPNAAGSRTELTPSEAEDNYVLASDGDDSTYNEGVAGEGDLYAFEDTPSSDDIIGLVQTWRAYDGEGGAITGRPILRTNSTQYDGTDRVLPASPNTYVHIWDVNPDTTNPWTPSEVDALELGVEFDNP